MLERIGHKSRGFAQAEEWDIEQQVRMTPDERQRAARDLKDRVYGTSAPDVREAHRRAGK